MSLTSINAFSINFEKNGIAATVSGTIKASVDIDVPIPVNSFITILVNGNNQKIKI